ncbi:nitrilase-related carbon-nitrogen hydrolase [Leptospira kmetyi]|uniref:nitrilase-related carbon-nitrogen hydrolase n=1 Tax=Leptospira kmetyi TaxID=408139 RepID=UPI000288D715|nr:nitrilase-related carbon-nitrogen hydrolase [Leptospira kmetyi]EQA53640.1 hydrolase, carbon-nitrogen family [Leptospira kmetyi serovar Malaysia str. Bejo-Iso9]
MNSFKRYSLPVLLCLIILYTIWSFTGRSPSKEKTDSRLVRMETVGRDVQKGNLLGIQPWMFPGDYSSERNFLTKIDSYLVQADREKFLNAKTIAVFPEYLGTWLVIADEKDSVAKSAKIEDAMQTLVLSNPISFVKNLISARGEDGVRDALFRMKAEKMLSIYSNTFSSLARKYKITIVAGSILLPEPTIVSGVIRIGSGSLKNVSFVFLPDGSVAENSPQKIYPIGDEKPFVAASSAENLRSIESPAGRIGVLVCADSWYPAVYETFKKQNVDFILVPSYVAPNGAMSEIWKGYNGSSNPPDVRSEDIGKIVEGKAWLKYAMAGRLSKSGASHGINVFLRGSLWDLGSDGETIVVQRSQVKTFPKIEGASIVNLWLN